MTSVYTDPRCLQHTLSGHPERPERVSAPVAALERAGDFLVWKPVTPAEPSILGLAHSDPHIKRVEGLSKSGGGWFDPDTFAVSGSYEAAACAVGAAVQATEDVVSGWAENALVLVRPPGHHATRHRAMGFCLFNNVAVAAQWALVHGGMERVAILDFDVHHGNGTQEIFYDRPDVLYCSIHQYPYYPGTGSIEEVGEGLGRGTTVNLPLMAGCGDETYLLATERVLVPAVRRFDPDCIFVSLGFDAHWADPLAGMRLSVRGYVGMLERVLVAAGDVCENRTVLLLEGGYDLEVLQNGMHAVACLLAGQRLPSDRLGPSSGPEPANARRCVDAVCEAHGL